MLFVVLERLRDAGRRVGGDAGFRRAEDAPLAFEGAAALRGAVADALLLAAARDTRRKLNGRREGHGLAGVDERLVGRRLARSEEHVAFVVDLDRDAHVARPPAAAVPDLSEDARLALPSHHVVRGDGFDR